VRLQAFEVAYDGKPEMLRRLLASESGRCLVFARTKRGADRIAHSLTRQGISAAMIHGDRSQSQRISALEGFQQGRFRVLVATDLAARGIHVQDIAHVINYDLPELAENFIHRVGRTGRAGGTGIASTLFSRDQRTEFFQLERTLGLSMERVPVGAALPEVFEHSEHSGRPGHSERGDRVRGSAPRPGHLPRSSKHSLVQLPGEFLQVQMET
jgi:ATP-dependent RNA helicase RhlE